MPVRKYRSLDEARRDLWLPPGGARILGALRFVLSLNELARLKPFPRGLHRYRSGEEAYQAREAWLEENIRRLQAEKASRVNDRAVEGGEKDGA
jgi:hypothetical protein